MTYLVTAVEASVVKMGFDYAAFAQPGACNALRKWGLFISPCGVRCGYRMISRFFTSV
jgi:hypothetical protein